MSFYKLIFKIIAISSSKKLTFYNRKNIKNLQIKQLTY